MDIVEIGIVDTRNIIKALQENYQLDFSDFALTAFKRRLEHVIMVNSLKSPEGLVNRIETDPEFKDRFLMDIAIDSTEMFRDPSLWRWLRDEYLPSVNPIGEFKIWIPQCVNGEELYTLCITLQETRLLEKSGITATCSTSLLMDRIKSGAMESKKYEVSQENYKRYHGSDEFSKYCYLENDRPVRDTTIINRVKLSILNHFEDTLPHNNHLILYRNKTIYFNPGLQSRVMTQISDCLVKGGILILGVQETLDAAIKDQMVAINENESVFRKK